MGHSPERRLGCEFGAARVPLTPACMTFFVAKAPRSSCHYLAGAARTGAPRMSKPDFRSRL
jgi:hypothetical protein